MPFFTQITQHDDCVIVTFEGGLDSVVSTEKGWAILHLELDAVADQCDGRPLVLDIENNWFNVCASIYNNFPRLQKKLDGRVVFCNIPEQSLEVLQVTKLPRLLNSYPTRVEAIASLSKR